MRKCLIFMAYYLLSRRAETADRDTHLVNAFGLIRECGGLVAQ